MLIEFYISISLSFPLFPSLPFYLSLSLPRLLTLIHITPGFWDEMLGTRGSPGLWKIEWRIYLPVDEAGKTRKVVGERRGMLITRRSAHCRAADVPPHPLSLHESTREKRVVKQEREKDIRTVMAILCCAGCPPQALLHCGFFYCIIVCRAEKNNTHCKNF